MRCSIRRRSKTPASTCPREPGAAHALQHTPALQNSRLHLPPGAPRDRLQLLLHPVEHVQLQLLDEPSVVRRRGCPAAFPQAQHRRETLGEAPEAHAEPLGRVLHLCYAVYGEEEVLLVALRL